MLLTETFIFFSHDDEQNKRLPPTEQIHIQICER